MIAPLKQLIAQNTGIRFITNLLEIQSPIGRKYLQQLMPIYLSEEITKELSALRQMLSLLPQEPQRIQQIKDELAQLHDIETTISHLSNNSTLDDIQLFEIKWMIIISNKIKQLMEEVQPLLIKLYDLTAVLNILDPAQDRLPHFYIYPLYDERLPLLHKKIAVEKEDISTQKWQIVLSEVEEEVRIKLSQQLAKYHSILAHNLHQLAILDLLIAKATLANTLQLCEPTIVSDKLSLHGLFNPMVGETLQTRGSTFQPVDISLTNAPALLTGANMSGKSVLLKTIGIAQHLFQYGFFVPAARAEMMIFDDVMVSFDDQQSDMNGLSSFAAEILNINSIIKECKSGRKILVLVDELARTTNPEEGEILVSAFLTMMERYNVCALISTHYTLPNTHCRRLRIKGLRLDGITTKLSAKNITQYIDYSVIESQSEAVPHEAIQIARIFDVDEEFLECCALKK